MANLKEEFLKNYLPPQTPPNNSYLLFNVISITATGMGQNDQVIMKAIDNGLFEVHGGRIGIKVVRFKETVRTYPMS